MCPDCARDDCPLGRPSGKDRRRPVQASATANDERRLDIARECPNSMRCIVVCAKRRLRLHHIGISVCFCISICRAMGAEPLLCVQHRGRAAAKLHQLHGPTRNESSTCLPTPDPKPPIVLAMLPISTNRVRVRVRSQSRGHLLAPTPTPPSPTMWWFYAKDATLKNVYALLSCPREVAGWAQAQVAGILPLHRI